MADTPETIYLIYMGEEDGTVWCDEPNPTGYVEPEEVAQYIRADLVTEALEHVKTAGSPAAVAAVERLEKIPGVKR